LPVEVKQFTSTHQATTAYLFIYNFSLHKTLFSRNFQYYKLKT